jgi:hypothetical protein
VGWLGREKRRWFFLSISMNSRKIQRDLGRFQRENSTKKLKRNSSEFERFQKGLERGLKRDWRREFQKEVLESNPKRIREEIATDLCTPDNNNNTHTQNNMRVPTHFYKQIYMPVMVH